MPRAKKRVSRPRTPHVSRSSRTTSAVAVKTVTSTKLALAMLFLGFSSLAAAAASGLPATSTPALVRTGSGVTVPAKSTRPFVHIVRTATVPTISKILLTNDTSATATLGSWKIFADDRGVTLKKISFSITNYNTTNSDSDFTNLALIDESTGKIITQQGFIQNNLLTFLLPEPLVIGKEASKNIILRGSVTASGISSPGVIHSFKVAADTAENIQFTYSDTGEPLTSENIFIGKMATAAEDKPEDGPYYLLHQAAPVVITQSNENILSINTNAPLLKFIIANPGTRDLEIGSISARVKVSGLTYFGTSTASVGKIKDFKLWEAGPSGNLMTQIGKTYPLCLSGKSIQDSAVKCRFFDSETINFSPAAMNNFNLLISAGQSRTFIVTANTVDIFAGKMNGSVSVNLSIGGATGFKLGDQLNENNWSNGSILYYYTPAFGDSKLGPFSASDSYSVVGNTLTKTL